MHYSILLLSKFFKQRSVYGSFVNFRLFNSLQATERLCSVIQKHNPPTLGNLYCKDFVDIPSAPGFFQLMSDNNVALSLVFVDYNCFPPVHLLPCPTKYLTLSEYINSNLSLARMRRSEWLSAKGNAFRLVNGRRDGLPGLTIDIYDGHAVICTYSSYWSSRTALLVDYLRNTVANIKSVKLCTKRRGAKDYTSRTVWGTGDKSCVITEVGLLHSPLTHLHVATV